MLCMMESRIRELCQFYLCPNIEATASDYERSKAAVLDSYLPGSPERQLARDIFSFEETRSLDPGRHQVGQLFTTIRNALDQGTIYPHSFTEPLVQLIGMLNPCKCMASISNADHLLKSGLGEFVRSSVCHFASAMSDEDSRKEEKNKLDLFYCLNLGSIVCTIPDNSACVLGDDDEFVRATVRLLRYRVIDAATVMLLWNFLESYTHQEKVLAAEPSVVECLIDVLMPGDNDMDTERNEGVIGCLACLARNPHCLQTMMDLDVPSTLVQWIEDEAQTMHCFFACMVLAHLATNWVVAHVSHTGKTDAYKLNLPMPLKLGLQIVNIWTTQKVTVEELREKTKDCYSWHSLRPLLNLLWSVFLEARRLASFSLAVILQGSENRDILVEDVCRDCGIIQCASWSRDKEVSRYSTLAMDYASIDGILPPNLQDMCRFRVSEDYYKYASSLHTGVLFPVVSRLVTPFNMTLV